MIRRFLIFAVTAAGLWLTFPSSVAPLARHAGTAAAQPSVQTSVRSDYARRTAMIPMRDGVKLFTIIVMPRGASHAPILLSRTPYDASSIALHGRNRKVADVLPTADAELVQHGYIRVFQDVRGRNKSEGDYIVTRPLRGPLNSTATDASTDAFDTIDWLVKNMPESNGRVGIIGSSYVGFTALMATIDPHPALKAAVAMSPMVDGWIGDDWFHNGALRQVNFDDIADLTGTRVADRSADKYAADDYLLFLAAGSAGDFIRKYRFDRSPFIAQMTAHASYDTFWQEQAVDKLLSKRPLAVPTMLVMGEWDQEDSYGVPAVYRALEPKDTDHNKVFLVLGPWSHGGADEDGSSVGPLTFPGDTALQFRRDVLTPFLDQRLKDDSPAAETPPVISFETGVDRWQRSQSWPLGKLTPLYLQPGSGLGFDKPGAGQSSHDDYVSDPARPVPFLPRPIHWDDGDIWRYWLVSDQRLVSHRPDVLTYTTAPLTQTVHIAGQPLVDLFAATSGTDSDWIVKLIDVFPEGQRPRKVAGYEMGIGMEIFRGRYVNGFDKPTALTPGKIEHYQFLLPMTDHDFLPGHRIMVQIQSSWFPLYDRNPQTFVPNIFNAGANDYRRATQTIFRSGDHASAVLLPIVGE